MNWVDDMISEKHVRIARLLVVSFCSNYNSADNKIKSNAIITKLRDRGYACGDAELREIIGYIRSNDLCAPGFILSDNEGYYYSESKEDMKRCWEAQYGRAMKILQNFNPLTKKFKEDENQLELYESDRTMERRKAL